MSQKEIDALCLGHLGAYKTYPFDETTSVFKVGNKMFAFYDETCHPLKLTLKCDPFYGQELRKMYSNVEAGYHMNKKHWNSIICDERADIELIKGWIEESYELVFAKLTKKEQRQILN